jgi:hypothetical protein
VRRIEFHPEAQDEFISAAHFYERQTDGLGLDFITTVQRTYEQLLIKQVTGDHDFEALLPMNHPVKGKSYSAGRTGAGEPDASVSARASENAAATPRPIYMLPVTQRWQVMNRGLAARIHRLAEPAAMA